MLNHIIAAGDPNAQVNVYVLSSLMFEFRHLPGLLPRYALDCNPRRVIANHHNGRTTQSEA
jgi:hypothetical protein